MYKIRNILITSWLQEKSDLVNNTVLQTGGRGWRGKKGKEFWGTFIKPIFTCRGRKARPPTIDFHGSSRTKMKKNTNHVNNELKSRLMLLLIIILYLRIKIVKTLLQFGLIMLAAEYERKECV